MNKYHGLYVIVMYSNFVQKLNMLTILVPNKLNNQSSNSNKIKSSESREILWYVYFMINMDIF